VPALDQDGHTLGLPTAGARARPIIDRRPSPVVTNSFTSQRTKTRWATPLVPRWGSHPVPLHVPPSPSFTLARRGGMRRRQGAWELSAGPSRSEGATPCPCPCASTLVVVVGASWRTSTYCRAPSLPLVRAQGYFTPGPAPPLQPTGHQRVMPLVSLRAKVDVSSHFLLLIPSL
jgi:hypothetical protein